MTLSRARLKPIWSQTGTKIWMRKSRKPENSWRTGSWKASFTPEIMKNAVTKIDQLARTSPQQTTQQAQSLA